MSERADRQATGPLQADSQAASPDSPRVNGAGSGTSEEETLMSPKELVAAVLQDLGVGEEEEEPLSRAKNVNGIKEELTGGNASEATAEKMIAAVNQNGERIVVAKDKTVEGLTDAAAASPLPATANTTEEEELVAAVDQGGERIIVVSDKTPSDLTAADVHPPLPPSTPTPATGTQEQLVAAINQDGEPIIVARDTALSGLTTAVVHPPLSSKPTPTETEERLVAATNQNGERIIVASDTALSSLITEVARPPPSPSQPATAQEYVAGVNQDGERIIVMTSAADLSGLTDKATPPAPARKPRTGERGELVAALNQDGEHIVVTKDDALSELTEAATASKSSKQEFAPESEELVAALSQEGERIIVVSDKAPSALTTAVVHPPLPPSKPTPTGTEEQLVAAVDQDGERIIVGQDETLAGLTGAVVSPPRGQPLLTTDQEVLVGLTEAGEPIINAVAAEPAAKAVMEEEKKPAELLAGVVRDLGLEKENLPPQPSQIAADLRQQFERGAAALPDIGRQLREGAERQIQSIKERLTGESGSEAGAEQEMVAAVNQNGERVIVVNEGAARSALTMATHHPPKRVYTADREVVVAMTQAGERIIDTVATEPAKVRPNEVPPARIAAGVAQNLRLAPQSGAAQPGDQKAGKAGDFQPHKAAVEELGEQFRQDADRKIEELKEKIAKAECSEREATKERVVALTEAGERVIDSVSTKSAATTEIQEERMTPGELVADVMKDLGIRSPPSEGTQDNLSNIPVELTTKFEENRTAAAGAVHEIRERVEEKISEIQGIAEAPTDGTAVDLLSFEMSPQQGRQADAAQREPPHPSENGEVASAAAVVSETREGGRVPPPVPPRTRNLVNGLASPPEVEKEAVFRPAAREEPAVETFKTKIESPAEPAESPLSELSPSATESPPPPPRAEQPPAPEQQEQEQEQRARGAQPARTQSERLPAREAVVPVVQRSTSEGPEANNQQGRMGRLRRAVRQYCTVL